MVPGRDENGRFVKGHKGGPGRPPRPVEEKYLKVMARTVKASDWQKIIEVGISRAKAGDLGWARFLAEYLMGKPLQRTEVTGEGGGPIETRITEVVVEIPRDADDL